MAQKASFDQVVDDLLALNPGLTRESALEGIHPWVRDENDASRLRRRWVLCNKTPKLVALPDSIGDLSIGGGLFLFDNKLTSLPEGFCNINVLGHLRFDDNEIASLPADFGNISVLGCLDLSNNKIASLPVSFGDIRVGGPIYLYDNPIAKLPGEQRPHFEWLDIRYENH
eukprot:gene9592-11360_t